jgi:hypothetical protein
LTLREAILSLFLALQIAFFIETEGVNPAKNSNFTNPLTSNYESHF